MYDIQDAGVLRQTFAMPKDGYCVDHKNRCVILYDHDLISLIFPGAQYDGRMMYAFLLASGLSDDLL